MDARICVCLCILHVAVSRFFFFILNRDLFGIIGRLASVYDSHRLRLSISPSIYNELFTKKLLRIKLTQTEMLKIQ